MNPAAGDTRNATSRATSSAVPVRPVSIEIVRAFVRLRAMLTGNVELARILAAPEKKYDIDVYTCPRCGGRMRLLALITEPMNVVRFLRHIGEPTEPPPRAPARDPPFWHSRVLRQRHEESSGQMGLFEEH
jgi:hypothetical protein